MYSIQAFGRDSSIWNLKAGTDSISPADLLITSVEGNLIRISIPKFNATAVAEGSFSVAEGATSVAQVSGFFTKVEFYINNSLVQRELYSPGYEVSKVGNYAYELSLLGGNDTIIGSNLNFSDGDGFQAFAGNDRFKGFGDGEYGDSFFGGTGRDTAIYQGKINEYVIRTDNQIWDGRIDDGTRTAGFVIEDTILNRDGKDYLVEVERLEFEQANVNGANRIALDIAPTQTAGKVYMLYQATFNRTPDVQGLGYWINQVDQGANITTDVAAFFTQSPEFVAKYGASPSIASYVDNLYLNVLGRPGEAGGVAYWNQELGAGRITRAAVLEAFATLPEGAALVADAIANGIQYQQWVG